MYILSYKMMKCDKYLENSDNTNLIQATQFAFKSRQRTNVCLSCMQDRHAKETAVESLKTQLVRATQHAYLWAPAATSIMRTVWKCIRTLGPSWAGLISSSGAQLLPRTPQLCAGKTLRS